MGVTEDGVVPLFVKRDADYLTISSHREREGGRDHNFSFRFAIMLHPQAIIFTVYFYVIASVL